MNNPGTVLLTIADMSIIEAEVEVDETDIPNVQLGQSAKVTVDAMPNKTFTAKVTEIGNSPIQVTGQAASQATNFKVVLTIDGEIPDVRPGFTCTAEITTATRDNVLVGPDPGDDHPGDGGRRLRQHRSRAGQGRRATAAAGHHAQHRSQARRVPEGARGGVRRSRQPRRVRRGDDRRRRREVLRGALRSSKKRTR